MNNLILYFVQSNLSLVVLVSLYFLIFRKQPSYGLNRAFLLFSALFSFLTPLIDFSFLNNTPLYVVQLPEITIGSKTSGIEKTKLIHFENILWLVYGLISVILLIKTLWDFSKIVQLKNQSKELQLPSGNKIYLNPFQNFSFLGLIFIKESDQEKTSIIKHEEEHTKLGHSYDILLMKILQSLFWINPVVFLLEKELRMQHEFQVDQKLLNGNNSLLDYQQMLLNQVFQTEFNLITNNFNQSFLKNRFTMMTKKENKKRRPFLITLLMASILIPFAISCSMETNKETESLEPQKEVNQKEEVINEATPVETKTETKEETFLVVEEMPVFPGGEKAMFEYIGSNIEYPEEAKKEGISGRVFITFIVEKDGAISNVELLRGIAPGLKDPEKVHAAQLCDQEAINVIKNMPNWTPGTQRGEKVRVQYRMPIKFTLQ